MITFGASYEFIPCFEATEYYKNYRNKNDTRIMDSEHTPKLFHPGLGKNMHSNLCNTQDIPSARTPEIYFL
jgi:hypothetical protein